MSELTLDSARRVRPYWPERAGFVHACGKFCPQAKALLLRPGEGLTIEAT
jgi:hypothetical protein